VVDQPPLESLPAQFLEQLRLITTLGDEPLAVLRTDLSQPSGSSSRPHSGPFDVEGEKVDDLNRMP
jgi:hypothetical protein